jgi:DNA modification methylase
MKPVELVEEAIRNSSRTGDTVLDPFAGTGTTILACERQERKARLIEMNPRHVDIICRRWEEFTGQEAVREEDGRSFQQLAQERKHNGASAHD